MPLPVRELRRGGRCIAGNVVRISFPVSNNCDVFLGGERAVFMLGVRAAGGVWSCRYPSPTPALPHAGGLGFPCRWVTPCGPPSASDGEAGVEDMEMPLEFFSDPVQTD